MMMATVAVMVMMLMNVMELKVLRSSGLLGGCVLAHFTEVAKSLIMTIGLLSQLS